MPHICALLCVIVTLSTVAPAFGQATPRQPQDLAPQPRPDGSVTAAPSLRPFEKPKAQPCTGSIIDRSADAATSVLSMRSSA